jgi:hypothetical protein
MERQLQAALNEAFNEWITVSDPSKISDKDLRELLEKLASEPLWQVWFRANVGILDQFGGTRPSDAALASAYMLFFRDWADDLTSRWMTRVDDWKIERDAQERTSSGQPLRPGDPLPRADVEPVKPWKDARREIVKPSDLEREAITTVTDTHTNGEMRGVRQINATVATVVGYWMTEPGACEVCAPLHNQPERVWRAKYPKGPAIHPNCVLGVTPVTVPGIVAGVKAQYQGSVVRLKLSCGSSFAVTPNHQFLTRFGFIRASSLVNGMHIVRACLGENGSLPDSGNPNYERQPTKAEQVVASLAVARGMVTGRVPVTSENLHGDARFVNGKIDVVFPESLLGSNGEMPFNEPLVYDGFVGRHLAFNFPTDSLIDQILFRLLSASNSSVGGVRERESFILGELCHSYFVRGGTAADFESQLLQSIDDRHSRYLKGFTETQNAFPGMITTSEVIEIDFDVVSTCHVYDFQTASSMYLIGNGVVSSNCRCFIDWRLFMSNS